MAALVPDRLKVRLRTLTPSIEVRILIGHPKRTKICGQRLPQPLARAKALFNERNLPRLDVGAPRPLTGGLLQLESEGADIYFRNIMIEPIARLPKIVATAAPKQAD